MEKLVSLFGVADERDRTAFRQWFLEGYALEMLAELPGLNRLVVNIVDVEPALPAPASRALYDAVAECWFDTAGHYMAAVEGSRLRGDLEEQGARFHVYLVRERVQLDDGLAPPPGERSPGAKAIYLSRRLEGLSDEEAKARWRQHAPLAVKHHAGMRKYVQNGVVSALTPGSPVVHGIAELHFPTLQDLEQRMYESEAGREAIREDVAGLVAESSALFCSEYVLRA